MLLCCGCTWGSHRLGFYVWEKKVEKAEGTRLTFQVPRSQLPDGAVEGTSLNQLSQMKVRESHLYPFV